MIKMDNEICKKLFSCNYMTTSDNEQKELDNIFNNLLKNDTWDNIYKCFDYYLRNECKTEDDVINYINLFAHYVGLNFKIPSQYDPYDLVGYILSKIDLEKRWEECGGLFDDFANQALRINLYKDPYYQFWKDPKIIEIANKYKKAK